MPTTYDQIADRILAGGTATPDDALAILQAPDSDLMSVVAAALTASIEAKDSGPRSAVPTSRLVSSTSPALYSR